MNEFWILIVILYGSNESASIAMQEFNTYESCLAAKKLVDTKKMTHDVTACVRK
jgi:hypothetical protein